MLAAHLGLRVCKELARHPHESFEGGGLGAHATSPAVCVGQQPWSQVLPALLSRPQIPAAAKVLQVLGALLSSEAELSAGLGLHFGGHEGVWGAAGSDDDGDSSGGSDGEEALLEHVENEAVLKAAGLHASRSTEDILRSSWQDVMERSTCTTPVPDDPSDTQDPLSAVSIRAIIRQGLDELAAADSGCLAAAAEQLGPGRELQALQELMKR